MCWGSALALAAPAKLLGPGSETPSARPRPRAQTDTTRPALKSSFVLRSIGGAFPTLCTSATRPFRARALGGGPNESAGPPPDGLPCQPLRNARMAADLQPVIYCSLKFTQNWDRAGGPSPTSGESGRVRWVRLRRWGGAARPPLARLRPRRLLEGGAIDSRLLEHTDAGPGRRQVGPTETGAKKQKKKGS